MDITQPDRHRQQTRHRVVREGLASVELGNPGPSRQSYHLLNISRTGVCFGVDGPWEPRPGETIEDVVLRVADLAVAGRLIIVHLTASFASGNTCGAEFHPFLESDAEAIAAAIAHFPTCDS